MKTNNLSYRVKVKASKEDLFDWHERPGAFHRLLPPWESIRILDQGDSIKNGVRAKMKIKAGPFWQYCEYVHKDYQYATQFSDFQVKGPFLYWYHQHKFSNDSPTHGELHDEVAFRLPFHEITYPLGKFWLKPKIDKTFQYRHEVMKRDIERFPKAPKQLNVLVTGASGLIGRALCPFLSTQGHRVQKLSRSPKATDAHHWDPENRQLNPDTLEGQHAIIHLAGEAIIGKWTDSKKARILESRLSGLRTLTQALAQTKSTPEVVIVASGINFYGTERNQRLHESSSPGSGFLAEVTQQVEEELEQIKAMGIRVVALRIGVVISPQGGALQKMLFPFKWGFGGRIGPGTQKLSWVAIDDVTDIIYFALLNQALEGPVNVVAPEAATNFSFKQTLSKVLRRPALLPLPRSLVRLVFGELADETLLADLCVVPHKLSALGYSFRYPSLESCLRHLLGK